MSLVEEARAVQARADERQTMLDNLRLKRLAAKALIVEIDQAIEALGERRSERRIGRPGTITGAAIDAFRARGALSPSELAHAIDIQVDHARTLCAQLVRGGLLTRGGKPQARVYSLADGAS